MKKTIVHVIENFGRGGAETMLMQVLPQLKDYNNIIVTFSNLNHFQEPVECSKQYNLEVKSLLQLPLAVVKLKKIIKSNNADIVHSHLYWPTFLARLSVPSNVILVTTVHNYIASVPHYQKWYMRFLDKVSYKYKKSVIVGVSEGARKEYFEFLKLKPFKSFCLYTFVNPALFCNPAADNSSSTQATIKLVTMASLSIQKNHIFLINAFAQLKNEDVELHIYGSGKLQHQLQQAINNCNCKVKLMGQINDPGKTLPGYDIYVMASFFEGFSLSVLEAMAVELPVLVTRIPSFIEQCADTAVYYQLNNIPDFIEKLKKLIADAKLRKSLAIAAKQRVLNNFTLQHHIQGLQKIYAEILSTQ